ncbi:MAG: HD domain-containing protein [Planctomycetes bacterium]|nr:HD domain-containing protein [Planctomycetota bacterium]
MLTAQQAIKAMRLLIVVPDDEVRTVVDEKLQHEGYERVKTASRGEDAVRLLSAGLAAREPIDLVVLGLGLQDRAGLDAFDEIRSVFDLATLLIAGREDRALALEGVGRGADDYLVLPVDLDLMILKAEKLLMRRFLRRELRRSTTRNETLFLNILAVMAKVIEAKDPYTRSHSEKVSSLSSAVAREMGFADDEVRRIGVAGILHDLGKMGIREAILKKPGPLEPEERAVVQRHPVIASMILEPIEQLQGALGYIKYHHEHFDGSGYPEGLKGEEIPLGARILHATEACDSMLSRRSYSAPKTIEEAVAELRTCSGTQFDPQVVEALITVLKHSGQLGRQDQEGVGRSLPELLEDITGRVSVDDSSPRKSGMRSATDSEDQSAV